ncbi:hybrid sensor histidine kinase/response regulator [Desulfosediminicola flagellatus]|uniref:hybrid sensor histidine kinase/response regulator n=1 Tax=Desulfosediminicola flagellatus TaxID=2569541 RepID=UPI0010ACE029|nr:PAS domain-containing protein [Desulfosediminicola flagellatus]
MLSLFKKSAKTQIAVMKVVLIYSLFSMAWITSSDQLLLLLVKSPEILTRIQTLKGWIFIIVTSCIIYVLLFSEINKVRRAQKELYDSEEKYRFMAELTGLLVYDYDIATGEIKWSGSITDITGYLPEEFQKIDLQDWERLIHDDDREYCVAELKKAIAGGTIYKIEYRLRRKDGSYIHIDDSGSFVKDDTGNVYRMLGSMKDVSARKQMEEQYMHSQKMEAIGTLAGGIAHDFNNILGAIVGYTELAKINVKTDSGVNENLDKVLEASNRAKGLVQQILTFSRRSQSERCALKPAEVVGEIVNMLRPTIPANINIHLDIDAGDEVVIADPSQLNQVLMNLCTNAFHAMESSGGTLGISLKKEELCEKDLQNRQDVNSGTFVRLSITDTGHGISSDIIDNIFDPFFTTKDVGKGTGMGLSIAHGIVKRYNGFISVESEPGKGATFHVFLPTVHTSLHDNEKKEEADPRGTERILLVDDEEALTETGQKILEQLGYNVSVSNSSTEALRLFKERPGEFDLVITDQAMPTLTGAELARSILSIRADIPVILCTGYSSVITESEALSLGIKAFAFKPLSKNAIARLIRDVLGVVV